MARSTKAIAEGLVLSERTVERHTANSYTTVAVHGCAGATDYALTHGIAVLS